MLHIFRRHPLPVSAWFRHSLVLTYAFPRRTLEPLLPPGLRLDTYGDFGFLAIALVDTERLRPSFVPAALGRNLFLSGYRLFVRQGDESSAVRGLWILQSHTDRGLMCAAGNLLTHYHYRLCSVERSKSAGAIRWVIHTRDGEADLDVTARLSGNPGALPEGSPFANAAEARRFAGPLPYTFDYERETNSIVRIRGVRSHWEPQPVAVTVRRNTFLDREPFGNAAASLANAFYVSGIPYRWERGVRMPLEARP
jgi:hypothetical protein